MFRYRLVDQAVPARWTARCASGIRVRRIHRSLCGRAPAVAGSEDDAGRIACGRSEARLLGNIAKVRCWGLDGHIDWGAECGYNAQMRVSSTRIAGDCLTRSRANKISLTNRAFDDVIPIGTVESRRLKGS